MTTYISKATGAEHKFVTTCEEPKEAGFGTYTVVTLEDVETGDRVSLAHHLVERFFTVVKGGVCA